MNISSQADNGHISGAASCADLYRWFTNHPIVNQLTK
jgi:hypothetical protein